MNDIIVSGRVSRVEERGEGSFKHIALTLENKVKTKNKTMESNFRCNIYSRQTVEGDLFTLGKSIADGDSLIVKGFYDKSQFKDKEQNLRNHDRIVVHEFEFANYRNSSTPSKE